MTDPSKCLVHSVGRLHKETLVPGDGDQFLNHLKGNLMRQLGLFALDSGLPLVEVEDNVACHTIDVRISAAVLTPERYRELLRCEAIAKRVAGYHSYWQPGGAPVFSNVESSR